MNVQPISPTMTPRLVIYGRVQGVFFRDSMRREAQRLAGRRLDAQSQRRQGGSGGAGNIRRHVEIEPE